MNPLTRRTNTKTTSYTFPNYLIKAEKGKI
jgi:hypothetical protein